MPPPLWCRPRTPFTVSLQNFAWALKNDKFHARVASIPRVFEAAAADMHRSEVCAEVTSAVWNRLLPKFLEVLTHIPFVSFLLPVVLALSLAASLADLICLPPITQCIRCYARSEFCRGPL